MCEVPAVRGHLIVFFLSCVLGFVIHRSYFLMDMLEANRSCFVLVLFLFLNAAFPKTWATAFFNFLLNLVESLNFMLPLVFFLTSNLFCI